MERFKINHALELTNYLIDSNIWIEQKNDSYYFKISYSKNDLYISNTEFNDFEIIELLELIKLIKSSSYKYLETNLDDSEISFYSKKLFNTFDKETKHEFCEKMFSFKTFIYS